MEIHIVGIGLEGAVGLSESVRHIVEKATLLVGSPRHLSYFPHHPAPTLVLEESTETLLEIRRLLGTETPPAFMVIFASGDPLCSGWGQLLAAELPREHLTFHPHVHTIQLAFNRIKVPWQNAKVIRAYGRSVETLTQALQQGVEKIAILTDQTQNPAAIATLLKTLNLPSRYQFWVCENLGGRDERVQQWPLDAISSEPFSPLNIVVLLRQSQILDEPLDLANLPRLGIPDTAFCSDDHQLGLMTPQEVRLLLLGELGLKPGQIIWDVGAGIGAVSIEIARLFPDSQIYAVEKTAVGTSLIEQNSRRFQVPNVISIHGSAPEILHRLRPPDRILISRSDDNLSKILGVCGVRLRPGGTIVLALSTLEHLNLALEWVHQKIRSDALLPHQPPWSYRLLQVQLNRSISVAHATQFFPLNPLTLLTLRQGF